MERCQVPWDRGSDRTSWMFYENDVQCGQQGVWEWHQQRWNVALVLFWNPELTYYRELLCETWSQESNHWALSLSWSGTKKGPFSSLHRGARLALQRLLPCWVWPKECLGIPTSQVIESPPLGTAGAWVVKAGLAWESLWKLSPYFVSQTTLEEEREDREFHFKVSAAKEGGLGWR